MLAAGSTATRTTSPSPADDRTTPTVSRCGHRSAAGARGICLPRPDRERPVAPEDVGELGAEQHERRHDERVERDRRLHALDRRVEVVDDLGDRDVHDARVEHHHELREGQEHHRESLAHGAAAHPAITRAVWHVRTHVGGVVPMLPGAQSRTGVRLCRPRLRPILSRHGSDPHTEPKVQQIEPF